MVIVMIVLTFVSVSGLVYHVPVSNDPEPAYTSMAECEAFLPQLNRDLRALYPDEKADVQSIVATCEHVRQKGVES